MGLRDLENEITEISYHVRDQVRDNMRNQVRDNMRNQVRDKVNYNRKCSGDKAILNGYNCMSTISFNSKKIKDDFISCLDQASNEKDILNCLDRLYTDVNILNKKIDKGDACSYIPNNCQKEHFTISNAAVVCLSKTQPGTAKRCMKDLLNNSL